MHSLIEQYDVEVFMSFRDKRKVWTYMSSSSHISYVNNAIYQSHTRVMDYDEACKMHLTPGVVHNFPKAVGVKEFCPLCTKISKIPI